MKEEYESLILNNTWSIVDLPDEKKKSCKRVYKRKIYQNRAITRYKAARVIKGYKRNRRVVYN